MGNTFTALVIKRENCLTENVAEFDFTTNKSFLSYRYHPITIPRRFYDKLIDEGFKNSKSGEIVFPGGNKLDGFIMYGETHQFIYFQIRTRIKPGVLDTISVLPIGLRFRIRISKSVGKVQIRFENISD